MDCKINDPTCPYHACMGNGCQKEEVLKYRTKWGEGKCTINLKTNNTMEMPCMCKCGEWFDLNDGRASEKSDTMICDRCYEKEEQIIQLEREIEELNDQISDYEFDLENIPKQLKEAKEDVQKLKRKIQVLEEN